MLGRIAVPAAIAEPDFALGLLTDPLLFVFLLLIMILFAIHILLSTLEARFNNKLQDLKSHVDQLEKLIKEVQGLAEKSREDLDSRLKAVETRLIELSNRVEELEKRRSSRRTKKTS